MLKHSCYGGPRVSPKCGPASQPFCGLNWDGAQPRVRFPVPDTLWPSNGRRGLLPPGKWWQKERLGLLELAAGELQEWAQLRLILPPPFRPVTSPLPRSLLAHKWGMSKYVNQPPPSSCCLVCVCVCVCLSVCVRKKGFAMGGEKYNVKLQTDCFW